MAELARQAPDDMMVFDEALTVSPDVTRYLPPTLPDHFFQTRGGSLGVGIPGALGVKLASPDKTVIGFTRRWRRHVHHPGALDGRALRHRREVRDLQQPQLQAAEAEPPAVLERGRRPRARLPGFDLANPALDFAELARSMGVPAMRVETPDEVAPAIAEALHPLPRRCRCR